MASNGTNQSELYGMRGGGSDGNSTRNRSMEQYNSGSGNPNLPMFNSPPSNGYPSQTGAGGQAYGYSRYQPPMMTGFNNQQWAGAGNPYSYNTPNSYGSNYGGGNFYTPYQSSQYGGGAPSQNPLPLFGQGSFPSFQGQGSMPTGNGRPPQGGMPNGGPYGQGNGRGNPYGGFSGNSTDRQYGGVDQMSGYMAQFATKPWQEAGGFGGANDPNAKRPEQYYKPGFGGGGWGRQPGGFDPGMGGAAPPMPQYTQAFSQMLGMI